MSEFDKGYILGKTESFSEKKIVLARRKKTRKERKTSMSAVDNYVEQNAQVHQFAAEVARIISGIPQMPEFSNERLTVSDVSKMTGIPIPSVRAGIIYGWLPIGTAYRGNKVIHDRKGSGRIEFVISPRKLWEETGYVWRGKEALKR